MNTTGDPLMNFDNDAEDATDEQYFAFVDRLSEVTAVEFATAKGDPAAERAALLRYLARGERANLTMPELIDFLGVSSPSILEEADFSETEVDAVFAVLANVSGDEIAVSLPGGPGRETGAGGE